MSQVIQRGLSTSLMSGINGNRYTALDIDETDCSIFSQPHHHSSINNILCVFSQIASPEDD